MGCCGGKEAPPKTVSREEVIGKRGGEGVLRRDMPQIGRNQSLSPRANKRTLQHQQQQQQQQQEQDEANNSQQQVQTQSSSEANKEPEKPAIGHQHPEFAVSQATDFRISHGAITGIGSDYESDVLSDTDPYSYNQTGSFFDLIDEEAYDAAHRGFSSLTTPANDISKPLNLVALLGLSTLHGLGGDAWTRPGSSLDKAAIPQMGQCEKWLKAYAEKRQTAAPLLALCELYHARGDTIREAEYLQQVRGTNHPLALLRCATEHLNSLRKQRDKGVVLTENDVTEIESSKQKLLGEFLEISKNENRVGAKAGKHLWVSYRKGSDGFPKDLHKAAMVLEKAFAYQQGRDNGSELLVQINKIKDRIRQDEGMLLKKPKKTPPPSPNEARKIAWSTPGAHSPHSAHSAHSQVGSPISPLRRGSHQTPPVRSDSSSSLKRENSLKRSDSQRSQVSVAVATINGAEVHSLKDLGKGRGDPCAPLSPSRRGKVSSHDRDFLDDDPDDAVSCGPSETASLASRGRRMSERGQAIHNKMRRESATPVPAFQANPAIGHSPRRMSLIP